MTIDRLRSTLLALVALVAITSAGIAHADEPGLAQFMRIRAPGSPTLAPDRTVYFTDWPDGVTQLFRRERTAPVEAPGTALTDFPDGIASYALAPDGRAIVVSAAIGGSEQHDLHLVDPASGERRALYVDPDVVYAFQRWLPDGSGFVFTANDVESSDFFVYHHDLASGTRSRLLGEEGYWVVTDVEGRCRRLLLGRYRSAALAETWVLDLDGDDFRRVDVADDAYVWPVSFLENDAGLSVLSDHADGVRRVYHVDAEGAVRPALPSVEHEVEEVVVNPRRSLMGVLVNEDGYRTLRIATLPTFEVIPAPEIEPGLVGDVDLRGRFVSWTLSNARTPGIGFACKVGVTGRPWAITAPHDEGVDLAGFTLPRAVTYPSFDGTDVPAFLYMPADHDGPVPFVVHFHGGPESQHRPRFSAFVQFLVSRGYGVLQPNVRGSTGYGRAFQMADDGERRWDSVRDGVAGAQWLVDEGLAERGRIATYGGSYGGFMAVATAIEGGALFGAAIDVVGIVNFVTFLEQTGDYRRALREVEYGALSDRAFLESISPIHRIDELDVPLLIAHGLNDPRVPVGEAMQLAVELQRRGRDPELLFFPDEGHGFRKLDNRLLFAERAVRFLDRTITGP